MIEHEETQNSASCVDENESSEAKQYRARWMLEERQGRTHHRATPPLHQCAYLKTTFIGFIELYRLNRIPPMRRSCPSYSRCARYYPAQGKSTTH